LYNKTVRDKAYQFRLAEFLQTQYNLISLKLTEAPRGFYGETWNLETADKNYFVKIDYSESHKTVYAESFSALAHLEAYNIDFVSKVIKTTCGHLFTIFDGAILGVFEWIDGENIQNETTKVHEYKMLSKVYTVPTENIYIEKENFIADCVSEFHSHIDTLKQRKSASSEKLLGLCSHQKPFLSHCENRLQLFAKKCQFDYNNFYITHGDAGGNVIQNEDKFWLVDWDLPRLAPPERDAWFCMNRPAFMKSFKNALSENGIDYSFKDERLCYYAYQSVFEYLNNFLHAFFELPAAADEIIFYTENFFTCWILESLEYADKIEI